MGELKYNIIDPPTFNHLIIMHHFIKWGKKYYEITIIAYNEIMMSGEKNNAQQNIQGRLSASDSIVRKVNVNHATTPDISHIKLH